MSIKSQEEIARVNWGKIKDNRKYAAVKDLTSKIEENQKEIKKWADFGEEDKSNIDRMKKKLKKEEAKGWMGKKKKKENLTDAIGKLETSGEGYKVHIKKNEGYKNKNMEKMMNQVFGVKTKEGSGRRRKSRRKSKKSRRKSRRKSKKSRRKRRRTKKKRRRRRY